jgi:lipid A disaccharide synthetase
MHAAAMIHELKKISTEYSLSVTGLGGEKLRSEGVELLYHSNELAAGTYQYSLMINNKVIDTKQMVLTK